MSAMTLGQNMPWEWPGNKAIITVSLFHRVIIHATKMEQLPLLEMKNMRYS